MTLNTTAQAPVDTTPDLPHTAETPAGRRGQLIEELTAELTSWNPREMILAFRKMHQGTLSVIHLTVLATLEAEEPVSMGHLADAMDVSEASMTGIVTRLEARTLVIRDHDDRDRRIVLVRRTDAGKDVFRDMDEHRRTGLAKLLTGLSDEELSGLLTGHRALRAARAEYMRQKLAEGSES